MRALFLPCPVLFFLLMMDSMVVVVLGHSFSGTWKYVKHSRIRPATALNTHSWVHWMMRASICLQTLLNSRTSSSIQACVPRVLIAPASVYNLCLLSRQVSSPSKPYSRYSHPLLSLTFLCWIEVKKKVISLSPFPLSRGDHLVQKTCPAGNICPGGVSVPCPQGYRCPFPGMTSPLACELNNDMNTTCYQYSSVCGSCGF